MRDKLGSRLLVNLLVVFGGTLLVLLIVRSWIHSQLSYQPLPLSEPAQYYLITISALALASTIFGLVVRGWEGVFYSTVAPMIVYLGWAIGRHNLANLGESWKVWDWGWMTVALSAGLLGLLLSCLVRFWLLTRRQDTTQLTL